jgi:hypothetical protein
LRVALRLASIYAGVALVAAYLLLPTLLEGQWLARSIWEPAEYWHSYGAQRVLGALLTGGLLDGPRIPVLTILAALGALLAARAWFEHPRSAEGGFASVALAMFVLGLLLFFGRPTWGRLLELLPFSGQLPFHRFICAVQFGGLLLAGFALSRLADRVARWSPLQFRPAAAGIVALLVVSPAIASTAGLASRNAAWRAEAAAADAAARPALERAFADFRALEQAVPGRGYAGTSWDWGSTFKPGGAHAYHRWSRQDLPAISYMYHTMGLSSDLEPAFDPRRRDHYELFNVRYLLADLEQRLPPFAERRLAEPGLVSGLVETEGYFGIVGTAAYLPYANGEADALRAFNRAFIASNWHAERRFVRIGWRAGDAATAGERALSTGDPLDTAHPAGWQAPRGRVISSGGHGDRYHARVQLDDPGIVLFRTSYHPNWQAELDGEPADTVMLSPGYLGVRAAPGEHVIEMTYRTPGWTRTLPWMGLGFLALVALADLRRGRAARLPRRAGA